MWTAVLTMALSWLATTPANAQDFSTYTRATFDQWLEKNKDAKPDFKAGDSLTAKDIERLRPFIPPGFIEQLNFPEFKADIIAAKSHKPRNDYVECGEKHQNQTKLASDGALENYVCGQPFPDSQITTGDPNAGMKAAWNFDSRWQNFGLFITDVGWIWDRFGGTHVAPILTKPPELWLPFTANLPTDLTENFKGGGTFQRTLQGPYERVYYSHLASLADKGGVLPVPGAANFEFKEFTGFHEPFDIRGTAFIIYRYADAHRADDAWAYIPNLRRVRRITAEVKSDSLLGTDHTLEDFYGFSGRPLEWNWKFMGWKDMLVVMDSKYDDSHFYGPNGMVPERRVVDSPLCRNGAHAEGSARSLQLGGGFLRCRKLGHVLDGSVGPQGQALEALVLPEGVDRGLQGAFTPSYQQGRFHHEFPVGGGDGSAEQPRNVRTLLWQRLSEHPWRRG